MPEVHNLDLLSRPALWIAAAAGVLTQSVIQPLVTLMVLFVLQTLLPKRWLSTVAFLGVCFTIFALVFWERAGPLALVLAAASAALYGVALLRIGLVAAAAATFVFQLFELFPFGGLGLSGYDQPGLFALLVVAALIALAARSALAGRSLFDFVSPDP
jgi:hypothetical protein